jgi:hypothetical protein
MSRTDMSIAPLATYCQYDNERIRLLGISALCSPKQRSSQAL